MAKDINIQVGANISEFQAKLNQAQKSLKKSGRAMQKMGASLSMSLTAPLALFGASIVSTAASFEKSMNAMKAVTTGGIQSFTLLEEKAKTLGATTEFSATQAAEAMAMLGRNGLTAAQILAGAADASLALASATGTDLSNAANIATDAMAQFNIEASEMSGVADLITGATVNSKFSIDDFQSAMAQAGGVAGAVGVTFKDFATTVSAISPSFASGSDAGTSLKTMLTRLVPEGKPALEMMKKLGIVTASGANQFFDAAGNMKSMSEVAGILQTSYKGLNEAQTISAAKTMFGADAMRAGLKMAQVGSGAFDKLAESIGGVSAATVAEIRLQGFSGAVLKLKSAFESLQLAIADSGVLDFATNFVKRLTSMSLSLANLSPGVLKLVAGFGFFVAAIGPAIYAMGALKTVQASLLGSLSTLVSAYTALSNRVLFYTSAAGRALLVQNMKTAALKLYNIAMVASRSVLSALAMTMNIFRVSTYKSIAATVGSTAALIANKLATIAVNVAAFAGIAIINSVIAAETAYMAIKSVLTGKIKIAAAAQMLFNAVLTANPIGLVVVAIAALVAAFVFAYQNIEFFRKGVDKAMRFIKNIVSAAISAIGKAMLNIPAFLAGVMAAFSQMFSNLQNGFSRFLLTAEIFSEKFKRALTIDGDVRDEITKTIAGLKKQKTKLIKTGTTLGEAYNKAFQTELDKNKKITVTVDADIITKDPTAPTAPTAPTSSGGNFTPETIGKTTKALKEQSKELRGAAVATTELQSKQLMIQASASIMGTSMNSLGDAVRKVKLSTEDTKVAMLGFNDGLSSILNQGAVDMATGIGEMVGSMATGGSNIADLGAMMLGTLGGVLGQVGQLAISTGVAMLGIKAALQSLNPAAAIIGGIALVALAGIVKSKASGLGDKFGKSGGVPAFAKGGVVDKPTLGIFGEAGPEVLIPKQRLDSLLSGFEGGGTGGGGTLTTRITGNDLEIILDKTRRKNNRVR